MIRLIHLFLLGIFLTVACSPPSSPTQDVPDNAQPVLTKNEAPSAEPDTSTSSPVEVEQKESPSSIRKKEPAPSEKPSEENKKTHKAENVDNARTGGISGSADADDNRTKPVSAEKPAPPTEENSGLSHAIWDQLLRKYVNDKGNVNYEGLKAERDRLHTYLDHLADHPVQDGWPRDKKIAYWINAYNAFTAEMIVNNYPVASIMDLHGGDPFNHKWIELGGETYSLNNIENDILRPRYDEPRIHFALVCAAAACPPLLNRAWTSTTLDATLDRRTKNFINNPTYNEIRPEEIEISKIFDWYREDFGNLIEYLNRYSETTIQPSAQIEFREYDWSLNDQ
ncbi:MAG: DUF547 domain-containing protein [Saprospiraceae bacterium]|nr:DUF547 domain-containing protein [Saprospiraceae bacterium]